MSWNIVLDKRHRHINASRDLTFFTTYTYFFFECPGDHRDLHKTVHSFPTRRSSDLFEADDVVRLRITTIPFGARMADPEPASALGGEHVFPPVTRADLVLSLTHP